jgi:Cof subfamily protein (haloacid dehalogenase superfamily)
MLSDLVVFDIDGTLLSDSQRLKKSTIEGIKELKKRKIPYTLATGRSYHFCRSLAKKLEVTSPLITCNGALIQNASTGQVLYQNLLPERFAKLVLEELSSIRESVNMYLTFTETMIIPVSNHTIPKRRTSVPVRVVDNLQEQNVEGLVKITIEFFDTNRIVLISRFLLQKYKDFVSITLSDDRSIDITAFQSNKGESLKKLAKLMDVNTIVAFGNHYNDLEMLQFATIGIAMNNAEESVKKSADYVTLSNNEDGILAALKQLVFKKG